jgi:hypothetical protein
MVRTHTTTVAFTNTRLKSERRFDKIYILSYNIPLSLPKWWYSTFSIAAFYLTSHFLPSSPVASSPRLTAGDQELTLPPCGHAPLVLLPRVPPWRGRLAAPHRLVSEEDPCQTQITGRRPVTTGGAWEARQMT